jgi:hypothetical protein
MSGNPYTKVYPHTSYETMAKEKKSSADRLRQWVEGTGLNMVDLAKRLDFSRSQLYNSLDTGIISEKLISAITQQFPETDMNWLLKGEYSTPAGMKPMLAAEPKADYNRIDKVRTAKQFLERDLVEAQNRVADSLDRVAKLMEQLLEVQLKGKS